MNRSVYSTFWRSTVVLLFGILAAGCGRDDVKVYRVAKENPSTPPQAAMPAGHPDLAAAGSPQLKWKTPEGWNEVPPGEMRAASFNVKKDGKQADVSVIPLPGAAGGDAASGSVRVFLGVVDGGWE